MRNLGAMVGMNGWLLLPMGRRVATYLALVAVISVMMGARFLMMILMIQVWLYTITPFQIEHKNGLGMLYGTMPVGSVTVVLGRYVFCWLLLVACGLLSAAACVVFPLAFDHDETTVMLLRELLVLIFAALVNIAVQIPLMYGLGFPVANWLCLVPFGLTMGSWLLWTLAESGRLSIAPVDRVYGWIMANGRLAVGLAVPAVVLLSALSVLLSARLYRRKTFGSERGTVMDIL